MPPRPPHHLVTIGGEHDIRRQRGQSLRSGNIELTESAVWAQDNIAVLPWTDVILGGRYTTNGEYGGFFSPPTTLLLKPGNSGDRFTYTRGFRSPTPTDLSSFFVEYGGIGIVGNPNLEPETSTNLHRLALQFDYLRRNYVQLCVEADNVTESRMNVSASQVPLPGEHFVLRGDEDGAIKQRR